MGKIKMSTSHNLLCRKFAAVCRKIVTSYHLSNFFLTHDADETEPNYSEPRFPTHQDRE